MARKVYCENTSCNHHKSGDVCDTTVKIGSNGKCKSFEKDLCIIFTEYGMNWVIAITSTL